MNAHKATLLPILLAAAALSAGLAGAEGAAHPRPAAETSDRKLGFEIPGTKDDLKLKYDLQIQDNGGGRVSVTFTLADEGRLKPLFAVELGVPSKDGTGYFDVVASLAPHEKDGKKIYTFQLTRELVERGSLSLKTTTLDGKQMVDWGYHRVPFAAAVHAMKERQKTKENKPAADAPEQ